MTSKNLVYFVIGGPNKQYIDLLKYAINTLRCDNENVNIMVMCDDSYVPEISQLKVLIHVTSPNKTHIDASMRKIEIFDYLADKQYENILYIDCDVTINGSLKPIFDKVTRDDVLYAVPENKSLEDHKIPYYQCMDKPYNQETLNFFAKNNIFVLNAGQFAFKNSVKMKVHFNNVLTAIKSRYNASSHFYEQSFLNEYFNTNNLVCYDIAEHCNLVKVEAQNTILDSPKIINHFYNASVPHTVKLFTMRAMHAKCNESKRPVKIDTRQHIGSIITNAKVIAEIGTFRGEFAQTLFKTFKPSKMYLVDPFTTDTQMQSGDQDGNYVKTYDGTTLYNTVMEAFKDQGISEDANAHVQLIQDFSTNITTQIPDKSLDLIYIDGDHSYNGVKADLQLARRLVKSGGWICGHDYEMNKLKAHHHYDFGVKRAVDEFCAEYGYCIGAKMMDGCVSYVIKVNH